MARPFGRDDMEINLFFEGYDSIHGYQSDMLRELDKRVNFSRCVLTSRDNDGNDHYDPEKYVAINYDMCVNSRYGWFMDLNDLIPLDREILKAMEPYEPLAVKMLCRITEFDIFTYDEAKRMYLQHLRFWNDAFVRYGINFCILTGIPHHTHDYVIYALAKIKGIPMCILAPTHIPHWCFVANDLYRLYEGIDREYGKIDGDQPLSLPADVERYYNVLIERNSGHKTSVMLGAKSRKEHARHEMRQIMAYVLRGNIFKRRMLWLKHGLASIIKKGDFEPMVSALALIKRDARCVSKTRLKLRDCATLRDYDKMAEVPDVNDRYVIFLLHQQPEATTLPQGGVFVEQELCVSLLAKVLKAYGIKLYVKEHFVQPYRMKTFYADLKATDNVKLIRSDVDSASLLEKSLAAATPAGSITLEAIANGKPVIVFGHGGFEHGPGIYQVGNEAEAHAAIDEILKNGAVDKTKSRNYLAAFAKSSIKVVLPVDNGASIEEIRESEENLISLFASELRKTFQDDGMKA